MSVQPYQPPALVKPLRRAGAGARRAAEPATGARRIAGLHRQGEGYRLVVVRLETPMSAPTVVDSRSIPASDGPALAAALASQKVDLLIRVVPSSRTIARCVPIPGANGNESSNGVEQDRFQLASALGLLAEAELPTMVPAHRRAAGAIRPGPETDQARARKAEGALLTGWPVRSDEPAPLKSGVKEEVYTAEIAALASLARAVGGAAISVYADRETGAAAMLASGIDDKGAPRIAARVLRADASSTSAWRASIQASAAEIGASVGLEGLESPLPDAPAALVFEGSGSRRIPGAPTDPAWLSQYGIAFGAAVTAAQPDPAARSLASLSERSRAERGGPIEKTLSWMAVPHHAALVITVCVLMWLFWPLGIAAARHWALARSAGGEAALNQRLHEAQLRSAFYETLKQRRWPMTKLAGDVAGAAPIGVTIDNLDIARDQGLSIRGKADRSELVTTFRKNLTDSAIFTNLATPNIETDASGVTFQLEAQIAALLFPARRADDFRTNTLAVRLYGERAAKPGESATGTAPSAAPSTPTTAASKPEDTKATDTRRPRNGRAGRDDPGAKPEEPTRRPSSASEPPPPISDAEIAKLDWNQAMKEWSTRKNASTKAGLDPAVKQRLLDEVPKVKARMDEVKPK